MVSPNQALRDGPMAKSKSGAARTKTINNTRGAARQATPSVVSTGSFSRIIQVDDASSIRADDAARWAHLGFDAILIRGASNVVGVSDLATISSIAKSTTQHALTLIVDIDLHRVDADSPLATAHPTWFRRVVAGGWPVDPRRDLHAREFVPRFEHPEAAEGLADAFAASLIAAIDAGAFGFAINWPQRLPAGVMRSIIEKTRASHRDAAFIAWAPGLNRHERASLSTSGFYASFCSLPWWDYRSPWFFDELNDLRRVGPVYAPIRYVGDDNAERGSRAFNRALQSAALFADGLLLQNFSAGATADSAAITKMNHNFVAPNRSTFAPVSAPWSRVGAWIDRSSPAARLALVNSDLDHHATFQATSLEQNAGIVIDDTNIVLAPAEVRTIDIAAPKIIPQPSVENALKKAIAAPRVTIESITPSVDDGRFPAKRVVGESVVVEADVFSDGHPVLAVRLLWCTADFEDWNSVRMRSLGNDRWRGEFPLRRQGLHFYTIEAGLDEFAAMRLSIEKKVAVGQNVALDVEEARLFIEGASRRAPSEHRAKLRSLSVEISTARDPASRVLAPDCAALMSVAIPPAFLSRATTMHSVQADRRAAAFASWYELFPRSQGKNGEHGTFSDVIEQLPRIASLGFDVLYFPPIHPIGRTNRKGKNNSLTANADEPGSPYAIGASEGGHDAIHPLLGTLENFTDLIAAAKKHGLEIALDFAVQCAPDHPWLKQHPEWFTWRPDGSMRYAENPPKKYEDIVNVDFYAKDAKPALWTALRDAVAFWLKLGVKIFRVDNPHTKPLPFWEWLIADLRTLDPDVLFLSEAFTRPKLMNRLAKIGFSQSYTYFTWRNTRNELETYMKELNAPPVRDFFRPNFFVNTPDINPYFLQTSGRPGFLIRAALATTLSGLWGMYAGFELCEAAALPGKEEYLDSEKYELRQRDWNAVGNINAEIAQLNRIRRENPALQTHLGIVFYHCGNSNILYFGKATPSRDNVILVAINLDPHNTQEADIEIPLWEFGMDDNGVLLVEDLIGGNAFDWRGKNQRVRLEASHPYAIWRVRAERDR
jgi:starch synthase (maltosyl-transferring)